MTAPLVSVIMAAYNAAKFIEEALDSILAQTYENVEIIVVDDGSTDDTPAILARYRRYLRYCRQPNSGGCSVPRNTGLKHSSGTYLCFMDADDVMVPERLAFQVGFMEQHKDVGLSFCDYCNFSESGVHSISHFQKCAGLLAELQGRPEIIIDRACRNLASENFGSCGSLMFRRNLLGFESGFDTNLKSCEDFHLYYRLARHTPTGIIDKVGFFRRRHSNNMSSNSHRMFSEGINSRSLLRQTETDAVSAKLLDRYIADRHDYLSRYYANNRQFSNAMKAHRSALMVDPNFVRLLQCGKGVARTVAIAVGLHPPVD